MQFSNTTSKNGILQMIEQTTNQGDAAITGNATSLAYFTNLVNQWLRMGHYYAWTIDKNWHFDDSNHTNFPFATTTIVNNQRDYQLPSTCYRIRQVECLNASGKYYTLYNISNESPIFQTEKEQETAGIPSHYRMMSNSIILYPVPNTAMITATAGLRLSYDRAMDAFATTDTTQEPGLPDFLQPICYYGPSWEWAMTKNIGNVAQMCERMLGQWPGLREMHEKYYLMRDKNDVSVISRAEKSYR